MFEILSEKLSNVLRSLGNKGKLGEKDIDEALRQIRLALLEADVNFKVVRNLLGRVREQAVRARVLDSLTPTQQIIEIINQEVATILSREPDGLKAAHHSPSAAMLFGLQGSGKTTTAAKLALYLRHSGQCPLLVAADTRRPAAIEQLVALGRQLDIPVYTEDVKTPPHTICRQALTQARETATTWVVIDTPGKSSY